MIKRIETSRLSLHIPTTLYNRIDRDSKRYGITKTALIQTMIVNYYRAVDSSPLKQGEISDAGGSLI